VLTVTLPRSHSCGSHRRSSDDAEDAGEFHKISTSPPTQPTGCAQREASTALAATRVSANAKRNRVSERPSETVTAAIVYLNIACRRMAGINVNKPDKAIETITSR
jgi:hypothetical protein